MTTEIPTGRYAILVGSTRVLVKLNRVTSTRRYTSVYIQFPGEAVWGEVVVPETKAGLYAELRRVDLGTAAYLYSCITRRCGICSRPNAPHMRCITRRYPAVTP